MAVPVSPPSVLSVGVAGASGTLEVGPAPAGGGACLVLTLRRAADGVERADFAGPVDRARQPEPAVAPAPNRQEALRDPVARR